MLQTFVDSLFWLWRIFDTLTRRATLLRGFFFLHPYGGHYEPRSCSLGSKLPVRVGFFSKGTCMQGSKQRITKIFCLEKMMEKYNRCNHSLSTFYFFFSTGHYVHFPDHEKKIISQAPNPDSDYPARESWLGDWGCEKVAGQADSVWAQGLCSWFSGPFYVIWSKWN